MNRHHIARKLRRIAEVKELHARTKVATAAHEVDETRSELESLDTTHADAEEQVLAPDPALDGARLQMLGVGREAYLVMRDHTQATLDTREEVLDERVHAHRDSLTTRHGRDELYRVMRQRLRADLSRREQREQDDLTNARRGREDG